MKHLEYCGWVTWRRPCKEAHRARAEPSQNINWYNCRGCQRRGQQWECAPRIMQLVFCGATLNIFIHNCFTSQQQIPWLWCHMSLQVRCWRLKVRECLLLAYRGQAHLKKKCLLWIPKTENLYCTLPGRVLSMSLVSHLFNFPHFTSEETEVQGNY